MSDIERRLLHAARELRAVPIEPPPLSSLGRPGPCPSGLVARLPALVMPVLFVLGGLAIAAGGLDRPVVETQQPAADRGAVATDTATTNAVATDNATTNADAITNAITNADAITNAGVTSAPGAGVPPAETASATVEAGTPTLTARQEVALIASLRRGPAGEAGDSTLEVRSLQQRYQ